MRKIIFINIFSEYLVVYLYISLIHPPSMYNRPYSAGSRANSLGQYVYMPDMQWYSFKSRKKNPQKLTQLSSRSHPRHLVGKRTAHKDTIIDITIDSQVNSNFPYRWPPASLTFDNYYYLFLYLYITRE